MQSLTDNSAHAHSPQAQPPVVAGFVWDNATRPSLVTFDLMISYLNTDLDLVAPRDLTPLASVLESRGVFPLSVQEDGNGEWYATLEIECDLEGHNREPDVTIRVMLDAIEALDGEVKDLWTACTKREFNIGYDCGDEPWAFNNSLANRTLDRIARVGASLRITLYPPDRTQGATESSQPKPHS